VTSYLEDGAQTPKGVGCIRNPVQESARRRMMLDMVVTEHLSDAERRVWEAFPTGQLADFGTGDAADDDLTR